MNSDLQSWYSDAVTRLYARRSDWLTPEPVPPVQLSICNVRPCAARPLFIQRQRVDRLWSELCEFTVAAHERAFAFSVHTLWIEDVLELLDAAPVDWARYRYEAARLLDKDDLSKIYDGERADIREIARRLRNYSRGLRCLGEVEARRILL